MTSSRVGDGRRSARTGRAGGFYPDRGIIPTHWHHSMLLDSNRCLAFQRAIERVVPPGSVVFDAGAGTGLLSYFAAQRARAVYAVEADPAVAALGRRLVALNGLAGRVHYTHGRAEEELPPEPVDVVLCEMLHAALAVEQQVPVLNAVRRGLEARFPGHPYRVIPESAVNYCQLLDASFEYHGYHAPFMRLGDPYVVDPRVRPLSALEPYVPIGFEVLVPPEIRATCDVVADAAGSVTAVRLLTQAVLDYDETLPPAERLIDWYLHYVVVPIEEPLAAQPGASFTVTIDYDAGCELDEIAVRVDAGRSRD